MRKIAAGDLSCLEDRLAGAYERQYAADSYGLSGADGYGSRGRLDQPDGDGSDPFFVRLAGFAARGLHPGPEYRFDDGLQE